MKIAFDVDGTLIHQSGELCDTPRYEIVQLFKLLESFNNEMYIWSGGGIDYAKRWRDKLGLKALVVAKGSFKPDIAVDDVAEEGFRQSENSLGIVNINVGPKE